MPFLGNIGDTIEINGETSIEWNIKDFFSLSDKIDDFYDSPVFNVFGSCWGLRIYPNGETKKSTSNFVGLYLWRKSGPLNIINLSASVKALEGKKEKQECVLTYFCSSNLDGRGIPRFCTTSELRNQKSNLVPNNTLTISCNLKSNNTSKPPKSSVCKRHGNLISSLKAILTEGKWADFTLKLGGREWPVHKMILGSRSEYFATMFQREWVETTVGEVQFDDIEEDTMNSVLHFIYTEEVEDMSIKNACKIYITAHKFLLEDLKPLCVKYMLQNMCAEIVCCALAIAKTYEEEDLHECALQYFIEDAERIFELEEWKQFKEEHSSIVVELLEKTVVERGKHKDENQF